MIKVLIAGINRTIGGIEKFVFSYIQHIDKSIIAFDLINIHDKICYHDEFEHLGCIIHNLPNDKRNSIFYFIELLKLLRYKRYDIIHVNMVSAANMLTLIAGKMAGCKHIIAHSHNTDLPSSTIRRILHIVNKPFLKLFATEYFACSKKAGEYLFGSHCQFTVIRNAIDVDIFVFNKKSRESIRAKLGISENIGIIGHIGRFEEQKNHVFLLSVFKAILDKQKNVVLLLIGEGTLEQTIKNMADELDISDKVLFYGTTNKIQDIYSAMDVFVFPSLYEGLGIVGVEAQASGLPVIVSNRIPEEMQLTSLVNVIDLKDSLEVWSQAILDALLHKKRENMADHIKNAGYDIIHESKILEKKYIDMGSL